MNRGIHGGVVQRTDEKYFSWKIDIGGKFMLSYPGFTEYRQVLNHVP